MFLLGDNSADDFHTTSNTKRKQQQQEHLQQKYDANE